MLPSCNLPGDVIANILTKLPVKSLLRFKLVCKSWCEFITSSYFIKLHLSNPITTHNLLILSHLNDYDVSEFSILTQNDNFPDADNLFVKMPPPFPLDPDEFLHVFDSCNGLVCLGLKIMPKLVLWNPATRKFRFVPLPERRTFGMPLPAMGLGYVEDTGDYKIVRIAQDYKLSEKMMAWVYTLSSDSWKQLDLCLVNMLMQLRAPVSVNGFLHWLTNRFVSGNFIVAFDVKEEVVRHIAVPDNYGSSFGIFRQLVVVKGCLSMVVFSESNAMSGGIEIWVMAEYGVKGSWSKQFTVEQFGVVARPLRSWKDGEILFRYQDEGSKKLMSYNSYNKRKQYFSNFNPYSFQVFNYVESLESVEGGRTREGAFREIVA
ncbi:hypothetical protein ACH5RR_007088 [Cinchona calisaya]|uniref:F-box domain-containing protein n=1 Tax=Cinchona calisaya TaxID=153742 RepID=A0ABD3AQS9_9GENT